MKWYPEIGDPPRKVLSNHLKGSIEPLKRFYLTPKSSIEPAFGLKKRICRTLVRGTSEPHTGFYRTFRIELPSLVGYPLKTLPSSQHVTFALIKDAICLLTTGSFLLAIGLLCLHTFCGACLLVVEAFVFTIEVFRLQLGDM